MTVDGMPKDDVRLPEGQMGSEIQAGFQDGKDLSMYTESCHHASHTLTQRPQL